MLQFGVIMNLKILNINTLQMFTESFACKEIDKFRRSIWGIRSISYENHKATYHVKILDKIIANT